MFPQVSSNRARTSKGKRKENKINHNFTTILKFELKIPPSDNTQKFIMDHFGELTNIFKKKDEHVVIINQLDDDEKSFTKQQLPLELEDFKED